VAEVNLLGRLRARWRAVVAGALLLVAAAGGARADAGWFASGDSQLRADLVLLNDAEVIRLPVSHWPLPRAAVAHALSNAKSHFATNSAVTLALDRVRARMADSGRTLDFHARASAGQAGLWRDFDTLAREDGEIGAGLDYASGRFAAGVELGGVTDPADGDELRFDGSHLTVQLGNWLVSANTLERWYGPGHESSLILSNNARPMPTLMVERAEARPWETPWLSWLGPWRFSLGVSRMESEREDIDAPLFLAWRVVVMPFKKIELGLSRTAQFCGEQLECSWDVFWNMIAGNDNVGIDATPENEPGNQMAGFDIRWNSPVGNLPYAIYAQYIGEDESSYLPAKYIKQIGLEMWRPMSSGGIVQVHLEYASTTCSANTSRGPYYNCAYNQGRFNVEGYRYHLRSVGHTADRDAENYALGASYSAADGTLWTATARTSRLNRDDYGDVRNTVASLPTDYLALELGWKGRILGEKLSVDLGVQSTEPEGGEQDVEPFGFIGWHHDFAP
jgi:hypothetical protein